MDRAGVILAEVEALFAASEYEVVDVVCAGSQRGLVVRVFVDKPDGVSIEDCARVSRAVGDHIDAKELLPGRYILEVSSPGVDRPLRRPGDYERFAGETAEVSTYEKIDGRHRHRGVLVGFDAGTEEVRMRSEEGEIAIPLGAVKKAHLVRDPWAPRRGEGGTG